MLVKDFTIIEHQQTEMQELKDLLARKRFLLNDNQRRLGVIGKLLQ